MQLQLEDLHRGLPGGLHVGPFHPGLGRFVTCEDLSWEFAEQYSLQRVGVHDSLEKPGSDVYRDWHDTLMRYRGGSAPDYGAIWVTYFPTHMIELYPHVLVLSTLYPKSPQETINIAEFYYPRKSRCSSASSSRPSAPPIWKPPSRTTRSANAWTPAGSPCCAGACPRAARTSRRWRTACCISMSGTGASWASVWQLRGLIRPRSRRAPGRREAHAQRMTVTMIK